MRLPARLKARIMLRAVATVISRPKYFLISVISTFVMAGVIIWSLNLDLLAYVLFQAPITLARKIEFIGYGYQSLFTTFDSALSLGIIVFTVLFGLNVAMLIYVIRRLGYRSIPKKSGGSAFIFAILGGGCLACGTSLFAPLLASLGAVSAPFIRDLGALFNWAGSALLVYSIYKLSLSVKTVPILEKKVTHDISTPKDQS